MQTIMKSGIVSLAVALAVASAAHAQHSAQLVIDGVEVSSGDQFAALDRNSASNDANVFQAFVVCGSEAAGIAVRASLEDPHKILDKKTRVEIQQMAYVPIEISGLTGGSISGQPAACEAKIQGIDKDKSGALGDGVDQMKAQLKCKASLAEELGLDEVQTAELEALFGTKVSCTVKGVPADQQL